MSARKNVPDRFDMSHPQKHCLCVCVEYLLVVVEILWRKPKSLATLFFASIKYGTDSQQWPILCNRAYFVLEELSIEENERRGCDCKSLRYSEEQRRVLAQYRRM